MCNFGVTVLPLRQEVGCIPGGFFVEWRWLSYWEVEGKGLRGSFIAGDSGGCWCCEGWSWLLPQPGCYTVKKSFTFYYVQIVSIFHLSGATPAVPEDLWPSWRRWSICSLDGIKKKQEE